MWAEHCTCWARAQDMHLFLFFQVYRPNQWMFTLQTLRAVSSSWWAYDIEVTGADGHAEHVPERKTLLRAEREAQSEVLS